MAKANDDLRVGSGVARKPYGKPHMQRMALDQVVRGLGGSKADTSNNKRK